MFTSHFLMFFFIFTMALSTSLFTIIGHRWDKHSVDLVIRCWERNKSPFRVRMSVSGVKSLIGEVLQVITEAFQFLTILWQNEFSHVDSPFFIDHHDQTLTFPSLYWKPRRDSYCLKIQKSRTYCTQKPFTLNFLILITMHL